MKTYIQYDKISSATAVKMQMDNSFCFRREKPFVLCFVSITLPHKIYLPSIVYERFFYFRIILIVFVNIFNQVVPWCTKHIEGPSRLKRTFSPSYPCVNSTLICNFPSPLPGVANLTRRQFCDDLKLIFADSRRILIAEVENQSLLLSYLMWNLIQYKKPFLDRCWIERLLVANYPLW